MSEKQSVKETLNIIRKALEDDKSSSKEEKEDILILNKLVKKDGTIDIIEDNFLNKDEVKEILSQKINEIFDKRFEKWLINNMPNYLNQYLKKK